MAAVDKVLVGEALVVTEGGDNEISHIDLLMGPRGSSVEDAFCNALCNNKDGFTTLLAVVAPNLLCKPNTILFNKVTIKGEGESCPTTVSVANVITQNILNGRTQTDKILVDSKILDDGRLISTIEIVIIKTDNQ